MSDSDPDEEPVVHVTANVPQMLHNRLVEEAHLRIGLRQASAVLAKQAAAVQRLERKGFPLAGWLRRIGKKPEPPDLRSAREEEKRARKTVRHLEEISRKIGAEVETLVDVHLAGILPEYPTYRDARKQLQEWEQAITQFQAKVGKLVDLLGQARNMASSGYDKKKKSVSGPAKVLIDRSAEAAKGVAKLAEATNEAARSLGAMPQIKFDFRSDELARLEKMDIGAMQADFDRIITMFEGIQKNEVEAVKAAGIGEAETKRLQAASYLSEYVVQIRQFADERHVVPEEVGPTLQRLEARYFNR
jgi:hypothetical protein